MRATWIISALRALARWFQRHSSKPKSPTSSPPADQPSDSPPIVPKHEVTDPEASPTETMQHQNSGPGDEITEEQPETKLISDENGIIKPSATIPKTKPDPSPPEPVAHGPETESPDSPPSDSAEIDSEHCDATASAPNDDHEQSQSANAPDSEVDDTADGVERITSAEDSPKSKRKPRNIGGRRGQQSLSTPQEQRSQPHSRPELICQNSPDSMTWEVVVAADKDCRLKEVHLDGVRLDHTAEKCRVPNFQGDLTVSCQDGQSHSISLFEGDPLIFKLRKNWGGEGRNIARITKGHFIVIAPASWERTGRAPVEPTGCVDCSFQAHYFHRESTASDEDLGGFREWRHPLAATGIELVGSRVFDDSDEGEGDLFVGDAPILKSSSDIIWARVGEEIEYGWGQNFLLDEQSLEEVLNGREGRFFVRVFDSEIKLLDSVPFRYFSDLRQILVSGSNYTEDTVLPPSSKGHSAAEVRFVGADGSTISPILPSEASQLLAPSGALEAPPHPDADRVSCKLASTSGEVNIVLELPRIWWRLDDDPPDVSAWRDTPFVRTRREFEKLGRTNVCVALLTKRQTEVRAGFDDEPTQPYKRNIEDERIVVPLVHFIDCAQIDRRLGEDALFNIECAGHVVAIIEIPADPTPEILSFNAKPATIISGQEAILQWSTRNADDARISIDPNAGAVDKDGTFSVRPRVTTKYTITLTVSGTDDISSSTMVRVKHLPVSGNAPAALVIATGSRWRPGKGYSHGELQDASLSAEEALERGIPVDKRRRTSHKANLERLRRLTDG